MSFCLVSDKRIIHLNLAFGLAFALWTVMFSPWTAPLVPFWYGMPVAAVMLITMACVWGGNPLKDVRYRSGEIMLMAAEAVALAAALWGVFWIGDKVSQWLFPSFARVQVNNVYSLRDGWRPTAIAALLFCLIGPAEEIFWRGYVQRTLTEWLVGKESTLHDRLSARGITALALSIFLYTIIHLFSLNFMLIMSALVCGVIWCTLYWLFPRRLPMLILSHAIWDAAVFVWFPI